MYPGNNLSRVCPLIRIGGVMTTWIKACKPLYLVLYIGLLLSSSSLWAAHANPLIRLATTTSTDNSGLLNYLLPNFEKETGYQVHVIAVGTGKALRMGRDGDVDVLLVHAPPAEQKFIDEGYEEQRISVMYNDFVIVGPPDDPAGLDKAKSAKEAMGRIASHQATFVSRGDDSGTHKKERSIWKSVGVEPLGQWYREAGQGMGKVLQITAEMNGYTLTDRGTWLAYENKTPLRIVFEKDPALFNPYSIIAIGTKRFPDTNYDGAMDLVKWFITPSTQQLIADYKLNNEQLFTPAADSLQQTALGVIK